MKRDELKQMLDKMKKDTEDGKLRWRLDIQTTEGNEEKYTVQEGNVAWVVDECL